MIAIAVLTNFSAHLELVDQDTPAGILIAQYKLYLSSHIRLLIGTDRSSKLQRCCRCGRTSWPAR